MRPAVDWRLYLVTDHALSLGRSLEAVVHQAVTGGVTIVQVREKTASTRDFIELARRLKVVLAPQRIPLIVNDRVDVALAADADGVHLGQQDMPVADARRLLGPDRIIGLSVETLEQARGAETLDVDYLGVSPIFPTSTKTDTAGAWGLDGLGVLRAATARPLVAIGGLNVANVSDVVAVGADGIAVVSAICSAADPQAAAQALRRAIDTGRTAIRAKG
jgi:thiamine-phosphate pyrophosphorylase